MGREDGREWGRVQGVDFEGDISYVVLIETGEVRNECVHNTVVKISDFRAKGST